MAIRRRLWPVGVVALITVAAAWAWTSRNRPREVETGRAIEAPLVAEWSAMGYVESRAANVTSPTVGRITRVWVEEGDVVHAGQLLASIAATGEEAGLDAQIAGARAAEEQTASSRALLQEQRLLTHDRERRAAADLAASEDRLREAELTADRAARTGPAALDAAIASADEARSMLRDLERGSLPEEIARAQADLRDAESSLTFARSEAARTTELVGEGAAPRRDLDVARDLLARAEATRDTRLQALALLKRGAREDLLASARDRLRSAESKVRSAEAELAGGRIEARRRDQARSAVEAARATLEEVRAAKLHTDSLRHDTAAAAARAQQSAAAVRQAGSALADRRVVASFAGIVGRRLADPGDLAAPGQPILTIVEPGRTWIAAEVDEQDVGPVRQGQRVTITVPAFAGRDLHGTVQRIGGEALPQTEVRTGARIVRVRISIDPGDRGILRPGMEVHALGSTTLASKAVLAPPDAISSDTEGSFAWVVEQGRVRRRSVRPGRLTGTGIEVVSGLRPGAQVVLSGKDELQDGMPVEAKDRAEGRR